MDARFVRDVLVPSVDDAFLEAIYSSYGLGVSHGNMKETRAALEYVFRTLWRKNVVTMRSWNSSLRSYFRCQNDEQMHEKIQQDGRTDVEIVRDVFVFKYVTVVPRNVENDIQKGDMLRALDWTLHTVRQVSGWNDDDSVISKMDFANGPEAETRMYLAMESAVRTMRRRDVTAPEIDAQLERASDALVNIIRHMDEDATLKNILTSADTNWKGRRDIQRVIARVLEDVVSVTCSCQQSSSSYHPNPDKYLRHMTDLAYNKKTVKDPYEQRFWILFDNETEMLMQDVRITDKLEKDVANLFRCVSVRGVRDTVEQAKVPSKKALQMYLTKCDEVLDRLFRRREMKDVESVDQYCMEDLRNKIRHLVKTPATLNLRS